MAEQETPHQPPDESLETANDALQEEQERRDNATSALQGAENRLKEAQQNLAGLQAEEQRLQKKQAEDTAELEDIPRRIQITQQDLENLQAKQQQLQNQEALSSGALARLIRKLVRKPARLTRRIRITQQDLENLQTKQQQLPDQQAEDAAELERLKPKIEGAERDIEKEAGEVKKWSGELSEAESKVFEKALEVRKKASEVIIGRVWKLEVVPDFLKTLVGGASATYASIPFTNLSYDYVFYCFFGINLFKHSQIQDFVTPALESLIIVNFVVWISLIYVALKVLARRKISIMVEAIAGRLYSFANSLKETRGKMMFLLPLFILSFIIVPGTVAWWQAKSISTPHDNVAVRTFYELNPVNVVTVRGLKPVNDLIHIGSSSTHSFFLKRESRNTSHRMVIPISLASAHAFFLKKNPTKAEAMAIPLSGIVCIDDGNSYCEPNEATPGPVVIVYELPPQDQPCEDCSFPPLTDGMQFYLVHQERGSLEAPRGIEISGTNMEWLGAFKSAVESCSQSGPPAKLRIDGFANSELPRHLTPPEANIYNCEVANRRAEEAIDFLVGDDQKYGTSEEYCKDQEELSQEELEKLHQKKPDTFTGKDGKLDFEIGYLPWQTFQAMEKSRPVLDMLQGQVVLKRALLNRSVRLMIVDAGGCKPPPSTTNTSGSTNSQ